MRAGATYAPPIGSDEDDGIGDVPRESLLERIPSLLANTGKPFTKKEVDDVFDDLMDSIDTCCEAADWILSHVNRNRTKCTIWTDLEDDDKAAFADVMILRAQRSVMAANAVRKIIEWHLYLSAGMVGIDAFADSVAFVAREGGLWLPPIRLGFRAGSAPSS